MLLTNQQVCFALIYIVSVVSSAENLQTNLKNLTEAENKNKPTIKNEENPLKNQVKKYLKECGADITDEEDSSNEQNSNPQQQGKQNKPNRGTYPTSYGSSEQDSHRRVYRDSVDIFNSSNSNLDHYRDRNNNKRRGNRNKNYYDDYEDDDDDEACMEPNRNKNNNRNSNRNKDSNRNNGYDNRGNRNNGYDNKGNRYGNRNGNKNDNNRNRNENNRNENNRNENNRNQHNRNENNRNENNRFDPYGNRNEGNEDFGVYGWGGNRGYNFYGGRMMARPNWTESFDEKRLVKRYAGDDDVQCLSQCAFGYLGLLDDNRVPSETELIKFIQNNIQNSTKRMQAIREARRCFARLVTSDNDDGCVFSKMLGKCLKLDIQDNS